MNPHPTQSFSHSLQPPHFSLANGEAKKSHEITSINCTPKLSPSRQQRYAQGPFLTAADFTKPTSKEASFTRHFEMVALAVVSDVGVFWVSHLYRAMLAITFSMVKNFRLSWFQAVASIETNSSQLPRYCYQRTLCRDDISLDNHSVLVFYLFVRPFA